MSKLTKRLFKLLDLMVIFVIAFGSPMSAMAEASPTGATVTTQLPDYPPGAVVVMTGSGWFPEEGVHIVVNADDQSWTLESAPDPVADGSGGFTYEFQLPAWFVPSYTVTASGFASGTATVNFTDANVGTYDQCANDDGDGYGGNPGTCLWTNGNLQRNNSTYNEGDATAQRLWLPDLAPGSTHTVTFKYGTTKGGAHAYDYLTTWNWSESWITLNDLCKAPQGQGLITGCNTASQHQFQIPDDPNVPNSIEPAGAAGRLMTIAGGTITAISTPALVSGEYQTQNWGGDSETVITVSYTVGPNNGSMCSKKQGATYCGVMFWFGAHVALTAQWMAFDGRPGATGISGSPYHVALDATDGEAVGQRDNQMQANAVPLNGTIVIIKNAVPDDAQDFNFNLTNGGTFNQNFSLDDDADLTLPNSMSFSLPAGTYTASELFPLPTGWTFTGLVCTVTGLNGSTSSVVGELATIALRTSFTSSDTVICTYTDTMGLGLTAVKTANGSYDRTVTWELDKSVDPSMHEGFAGDSFNSTWTLVAVKTAVPGNFKVEGAITVNNPNNYGVPVTITDQLSDGTIAAVDCDPIMAGDQNVGNIPALGSLTCSYTAYPTNNSATSNTATITSSDPNVGGTSATKAITWTENLIGSDSADLTDPRFAGLPWNYAGETISASTTRTIEETFNCSTDPSRYTNGSYTESFTNTAYLKNVNTDLNASAQVGITCHLPALQVTKTAMGEWERTVTWTLDKSVVESSYSGFAGEEFKPTWTVALKKIVSGPKNWYIHGDISIHNPTNIALDFTVNDTLDDGTPVTVSCPSNTVAAGATVTCTYEAFPDDASATLNTVTIMVAGNQPQVATAAVIWKENLTGSDSGNLTDPRFEYDELVSGSTTATFEETFACSTDPSHYTDGSYTETFTNNAYFKNIDTNLHDDASVDITCHLPALQVTKTAQGEWDRTVTWTLDKSVVESSYSGSAGDSFTPTWTVVLTKHDSGPMNYSISGEIQVYNPASIPQIFTVADTLDDGTPVAVSCPKYTAEPLETVTCTYEATPADASAKLNTVTITFAGNTSMTATAEVKWHENLTGSDSGELTDPRFDYDELVSGSTTATFEETFSCSTDPSRYTNGSYSDTFTNDAYFKNIDTNLHDNASVGITCHLPALQVTKTAQGVWDRTVTWTLDKSVVESSYSGSAGDSFTPTWTVILTKTDTGSINYKISGEIKVHNPAGIPQTFTVADTLDDGTPVTISCPSDTVAPLETVTCTYEATPDDASAKLNTVTVSAIGNADVTATAAVPWKENLTGSDSGNLTDPHFNYDAIVSESTTFTQNETFSCSTDPSRYTSGSYTETFTNDAYFKNVDTDLHDDASVGITCHLPALQVTKTAQGEWDRTVTWTLDKSVVENSYSGFAGDSFTPTWTVVLTKHDSGPMNWTISGEIKVYNPSAIPQTFTLADTLDDGTPVTVSCPTDMVAPLETVTCAYEAKPDDASAKLNTVTVSAIGNADATATAVVPWTENLTGSDSGILTDPRFDYEKVVSETTTLIRDETFSCSTDPSGYTNGSYSDTFTNDAYFYNINHDLHADASVGITCTLLALEPSKTAIGEWDRTVTWTLDKSVVENSYSGVAGDSFTPTWTVTLTKIDTGPMNYKITGEIQVYNPASIPQTFTVIDTLDDGTPVAVSCPKYTAEPLETVTCTYQASPKDASATLNIVTIDFAGNTFRTATADVKWHENLTGSDSGELTDPRFSYDEEVNVTTSVDLKETFSCSTDPSRYTDGSYTETFTNDAYFKNVDTDLHDDASVGITCHLPALQVTKTAQGVWDRTVTWTLDKSVVENSYSGVAGDSFTPTWTVVLTKHDSGPTNYSISGEIKVYNPSAIPQTFTVADTLDEGTPVTVSCPTDMVAPLETVTCTYKAKPDDASAKLNTAVVSAVGNADATATAAVPWKENLIGSDSGELTDPRFNYDQELSETTSVDFNETFSCSTDPKDYNNGSYTTSFTNDAYFKNVNHDLHDDASVGITCHLPALQVTKTAQGEWDRVVTWTLEKSVSKDVYSGYPGDAFKPTWTVVLTKHDSGPMNWTISGEIKVYNPSAIPQTFTLADTLDDGTPVTVSCPTDMVAPLETVTCTYEAAPDDASAILNTVTISASGNADVTATAAVPWKENLTGSDSGELADPRFEYDKNVSASGTVNFNETFTCSSDPSRYTNGSYTEAFTNDAYFKNIDTDLHDDASVGITCYWPQIELTKTGDALSKIGDPVTYTFKLENLTPTAWDMRALSCTISDPLIGFSKTVELASGAVDTSTKTINIPANASDPFNNTASATCSPLGSTFSVSDSSTWSTNLFQPKVEIIKTGPQYATSGDVIAYIFTINNLSSSDSPHLILDTLTDDVLGDLKATALTSGCDNLPWNGSCTFTADYTVPEVGLQSKTIKNIVTVHYHPAGFPNDITDTDDHTVTVTPKSQLTDTSFCPLPNNQFRLLYHLEVAPNIYRLQASNPGQWYMNAFYYGTPGSDFTMTIQIPYPFMTQEGAGVPIQVHDGTALTSNGCYLPNPMLAGYTITTPAMTPTSSAGNQIITAEDYTTKNLGAFTTVTVSGKVPSTGIAYVTIHLDYSLKRTGGWKQPGTYTTNPVNGASVADVLNQTGFGSGPITIHGYEVYTFARTVGSDTSSTKPSSFNEFKKFAGFMGFITNKSSGNPVANAKVVIYTPLGKVLATVYTDADGYYMYAYKHTAKSAIYKVTALGFSVSITVKANGLAAVDFEMP